MPAIRRSAASERAVEGHARGSGASAPTAFQDLRVLVLAGAFYWHDVGGFKFNSPSSSRGARPSRRRRRRRLQPASARTQAP